MNTVYLADPDATHAFGVFLGERVSAGLVMAVHGDLGAGKTTLAQGVARGLGVPSDHYVNSPTFAILQTHPGRLPFHHIDLYRLADIDEAYGIGLDEVIGADGVAFVEWPSRVPELCAGDQLRISIHPDGEGRQVTLEAMGTRAEAFLHGCAITNGAFPC